MKKLLIFLFLTGCSLPFGPSQEVKDHALKCKTLQIATLDMDATNYKTCNTSCLSTTLSIVQYQDNLEDIPESIQKFCQDMCYEIRPIYLKEIDNLLYKEGCL